VTSEQDGEVFVIDTEAHKVIKSLKVGNRPRSVGFFPDGKKAYVINENDGTLAIIDIVKYIKIGEIALGKSGVIKPMKVILSTDGKIAYVSTGRGKQLFLIDTATDKIIGMPIEVGERPWGIALSPDGKFLYTANGPSNDVSVVDLSTNTVIKKIMAGSSPWGVLVVQP
jgi:YVTN family beta-propeller protein